MVKRLFHKLVRGEIYKIISPSRSLHGKFGEHLERGIIGKAQEIYGDDFMNLSEERVCRFYIIRLGEIPYFQTLQGCFDEKTTGETDGSGVTSGPSDR
jgi:hypothetical protein